MEAIGGGFGSGFGVKITPALSVNAFMDVAKCLVACLECLLKTMQYVCETKSSRCLSCLGKTGLHTYPKSSGVFLVSVCGSKLSLTLVSESSTQITNRPILHRSTGRSIDYCRIALQSILQVISRKYYLANRSNGESFFVRKMLHSTLP